MKSKLRQCIKNELSIIPEHLEEILDCFSPLQFNAGESFIRPGSICRKMAFINNGAFRIYNIKKGREITLWIGIQSNFITELTSFVYNRPSRWFIEALVPSEVLVIHREEHFLLLDKYPEWIEFDNKILINAFSMLEQRMFSQLYMSAEERYLELEKERPELLQTVPLKYIASMLGMSPETLSRLRKNRMN